MNRTRVSSGAVAAAAAAACLFVGAAEASAATTTADTSPTPVSQGINPVNVPGASVFGDTPSDTPETVSFALKLQNESTLQQQVQAGLKNFLSVSQFASTYGTPGPQIGKLTAYLQSYGITTKVMPNNLDVQASGTAGEFDAALAVSQKNYHIPAQKGPDGNTELPAQDVHASPSDPKLPEPMANFVEGIFGLTNYSVDTDSLTKAPQAVTAALGNANATPNSLTLPVTSDPSASDCEAATGWPSACHTPADYASRYGLDPLYQAGAKGKGKTVGIITYSTVDPGAPQDFWSKVLGLSSYPNVSTEGVDGGDTAAPNGGSEETDLDIEQSGAVAPQSNVKVYEAPNNAEGNVDAWMQAAADNTADTVSQSWGLSETGIEWEQASGLYSQAYQDAGDEALLEMAAQGQSAFTSAGDSGVYEAKADLGATNIGTEYPSSSPYITSAGGTTLPFSIGTAVNVPKERSWGEDYLWTPLANATGNTEAYEAENVTDGGGGGYSDNEPMPSYQKGVSGTTNYNSLEYLTPIDPQTNGKVTAYTNWTFNGNPPVTSGTNNTRVQPDISADADFTTGYLAYTSGGLTSAGGTSFVAPQLNGSAAVIDSALGHRVGLWNPTLYSAATSSNSATTPLNDKGPSNDNLYYTGTPGTVFNPASGLGTPNLAKLAIAFTH